MVRRRENKATYRIYSNSFYLVTLTRLENNYYGNPRYEAIIINLHCAGTYITSLVYRFTGHYMDDIKEAEWIVKYHETHK